jgi:hypothetical protein
MLICLHTVCGCFCAPMAELRSFKRDHMACCLALWRKNLLESFLGGLTLPVVLKVAYMLVTFMCSSIAEPYT